MAYGSVTTELGRVVRSNPLVQDCIKELSSLPHIHLLLMKTADAEQIGILCELWFGLKSGFEGGFCVFDPGSTGIVMGTLLVIVDLPGLDAPNDHLPSV